MDDEYCNGDLSASIECTYSRNHLEEKAQPSCTPRWLQKTVKVQPNVFSNPADCAALVGDSRSRAQPKTT